MIEPGRFRTASPEETEALGRRVGASLDGPAVLLLSGDLGAGKTLFTRGVVEGLGADPDDVSSPTFSLVNRYDGGRLPVYHLDLYRIDGPHAVEALYGIGLDEILDERAVVVVEWADRLAGFPVRDAWHVAIAYEGDEERVIDVGRELRD
jgi:tRNA threonylcarbamoyladenosine biosynthesis protein TsaE